MNEPSRPTDVLLGEAVGHQRAGRPELAEAALRRLLALEPSHADAHVRLGLVVQAQGRAAEALAHYEAALALRPDLALAHNNRGAVLQALGRFDEAATSHAAALAVNPGSVSARINLGSALFHQGRLAEAAAQYRAALELEPAHPFANANLGLALERLGEVDAAVSHHRTALAAQPDNAEFHNNLALALQAQGHPADAAAAFERAIGLSPHYVDAHVGLGIVRLLMGDLAGGWPEYEWRLARPNAGRPARAAPRWEGGELGGRTIRLQAEQGLGDSIQFVRYAAILAGGGARVVLAAPKPLARLFNTAAGVEQVIDSFADAPGADCWSPLLSLPGLVGTTLASVPAGAPYLAADPLLVAHWRERLAGLRGTRVGVAWRGNPDQRNDRARSADPAVFARFLDAPGLAVVNLQKDARADELAALGVEAFDAGPHLGDLADAAAVMANLDLVITVDTAIAHLAGAIGAPVWTLLAFAPDWRWLLERKDCPWYPGMRLFRQPGLGDWAAVAARVRAALAETPPKSR